ncbi:MAG: metallopeptidase family protein [Lachnospiraceae bacterium]|nr:metallopeptidase family protein [Lachnospiraceae bacterium]
MITIDEAMEMLDDIYDELPVDFHKDLNGGVILSPEMKMHPASDGNLPLYILGEYHSQPRGLGRFIIIYYGSFAKAFSYLQPQQLREKLRKTLLHEFTHHLESLAGERGLEIEDARRLARYKHRPNNQKKSRYF